MHSDTASLGEDPFQYIEDRTKPISSKSSDVPTTSDRITDEQVAAYWREVLYVWLSQGEGGLDSLLDDKRYQKPDDFERKLKDNAHVGKRTRWSMLSAIIHWENKPQIFAKLSLKQVRGLLVSLRNQFSPKLPEVPSQTDINLQAPGVGIENVVQTYAGAASEVLSGQPENQASAISSANHPDLNEITHPSTGESADAPKVQSFLEQYATPDDYPTRKDVITNEEGAMKYMAKIYSLIVSKGEDRLDVLLGVAGTLLKAALNPKFPKFPERISIWNMIVRVLNFQQKNDTPNPSIDDVRDVLRKCGEMFGRSSLYRQYFFDLRNPEPPKLVPSAGIKSNNGTSPAIFTTLTTVKQNFAAALSARRTTQQPSTLDTTVLSGRDQRPVVQPQPRATYSPSPQRVSHFSSDHSARVTPRGNIERSEARNTPQPTQSTATPIQPRFPEIPKFTDYAEGIRWILGKKILTTQIEQLDLRNKDGLAILAVLIDDEDKLYLRRALLAVKKLLNPEPKNLKAVIDHIYGAPVPEAQKPLTTPLSAPEPAHVSGTPSKENGDVQPVGAQSEPKDQGTTTVTPSETLEDQYLNKIVEIQRNAQLMEYLGTICPHHAANRPVLFYQGVLDLENEVVDQEIIEFRNTILSLQNMANLLKAEEYNKAEENMRGPEPQKVTLMDLMLEVYNGGSISAGQLELYSSYDTKHTWEVRVGHLLFASGVTHKDWREAIAHKNLYDIGQSLRKMKFRAPLEKKHWRGIDEAQAQETDLYRFLEAFIKHDHHGRRDADQVNYKEFTKKMGQIRFPQPSES